MQHNVQHSTTSNIESRSNMMVMAAVMGMTMFAGVAKRGVREDYMDGQNSARASVGVAPLKWDERVQSYAISYAQQRKANCALQHSRRPYGENIFWGIGKDWMPADAVNAWVAESKDFDFADRVCDQDKFFLCGHYQQIVWRATTKVGCAKVTCDNGATFTTCKYDPRGNIVGQKPF